MKTKAKIIACLLAVMTICAITFVGCNMPENLRRKLTFEVDGAAYKQIVTEVNATVELPAEPTKEGYEFDGWYYDKDVWNKAFEADSLTKEPLTENLTVYAKWKELTYTVTFVSEGETLKTETVEYGKSATAPTEPTREGYTFTGWDKEFTSVKQNLTITAEWTINTYTVTFVSEGETAKTETVEYGKSATAPELSKEGYTLTWDKEFTNVKQDFTITAEWTINTYTVTFVSEGETLKTETVEYGKSATAPTEPTREGYTFTGWDKEFASVKQNLTITAEWTINTYTVTFVSEGETAKTETVEYGKSATAPELSKEGYTLTWDKEFTNVKQDLTVTAVWTVNTYTIKFINADGTELQSEVLEYGQMPVYDGEPSLASDAKWIYTFKGWHKEVVNVTENAVYVATYQKTDNNGYDYSCTYSSAFTDYTFENTALAGDGEWNVTLDVQNYYHKGGVKLLSDTGSYISLVNDQSQALYMQYNEGNTTGYTGGAQKGGMISFTMTFKFVKLGGKIYGYIDGRSLGSYDETVAPDMFGEHKLTLATYRGTADTGLLNFKVSASKHVYAIDGTIACTDKFEGLSAKDDFTFTAGVQGTGLYTYAGIKVICGDNFIEFYSHTYNGNVTMVKFGNVTDGERAWNSATVLTGVNIANNEKGLYKVVKTSDNMSLYLNDTLIFQMNASYALARNWGELFFADGATYEFARLVEAGPGGTGYYCDVSLTEVKNEKFAINGENACTDKFENYKAVNEFTFTATAQGTGLYTHAGIRISCGENYIDFYSHTYGGNATFVRFNGWKQAPLLANVKIENNEKGVYKVVKTGNEMYFYLNDTLIFQMDDSYELDLIKGSVFFNDGDVYEFGQYVEAGPGGTGYYCDLSLEY